MPTDHLGYRVTVLTLDEVRQLPRVTLDRLLDLPGQPGTYFVFSGDDLLYVGMSSVSLRQRWSGHDKRRKFQAYADVQVAYAVAEDGFEAICTERHFIETSTPRLNTWPKGGSVWSRSDWDAIRRLSVSLEIDAELSSSF